MPSAPASPASRSSSNAPIEDLAAPAGPPGLVIVNPPYGDRIGEKARLQVALPRARANAADAVCRLARGSDDERGIHLRQATGLPFALDAAPVLHGGLRVTLYRTAPLP